MKLNILSPELPIGKNIRLRLADVFDAEFIMALRLNEEKTKYLSKIDNNLSLQQKWLQEYKIRENNKDEYYFIICDNKLAPFGTVRIYDLIDDSFSWGSWLIDTKAAPLSAGIESALLVYEFAYYKLNFNRCHFEVVSNNSKVRGFHKKMGAWVVSEDAEKTYYNYSRSAYEMIKPKYIKFLRG